LAIGCAKTSTPTPAPAPSPAAVAAPRPAGPVAPTSAQTDSINALNDKAVAAMMAQIAGKENLPAEQVFKDIQVLKGQPAGRLLTIMNSGYSRALGVTCAHCHNTADYSSNERGQKKEARGMIRMVTMINEGNRQIPEFAGDPPVVNCVVCHRGARRPVNRLPGQGGGQPGRGGQPPAQPPRTGD
jgi:hypothetical protein